MKYPEMLESILSALRKAADEQVGAKAMIETIDTVISGQISAVARRSAPDVTLAFLVANPEVLDWQMDHNETRFADDRFVASCLGIGGFGAQSRRPPSVHVSATTYLADLLRGKIRGDLKETLADFVFNAGKPLRQTVLDLYDVALDVAAVDEEMKDDLSQLKGHWIRDIRKGNVDKSTVNMTQLMFQILGQWHRMWGPKYRDRLDGALASRFEKLLRTVDDAHALYCFAEGKRFGCELAGKAEENLNEGVPA